MDAQVQRSFDVGATCQAVSSMPISFRTRHRLYLIAYISSGLWLLSMRSNAAELWPTSSSSRPGNGSEQTKEPPSPRRRQKPKRRRSLPPKSAPPKRRRTRVGVHWLECWSLICLFNAHDRRNSAFGFSLGMFQGCDVEPVGAEKKSNLQCCCYLTLPKPLLPSNLHSQ